MNVKAPPAISSNSVIMSSRSSNTSEDSLNSHVIFSSESSVDDMNRHANVMFFLPRVATYDPGGCKDTTQRKKNMTHSR